MKQCRIFSVGTGRIPHSISGRTVNLRDTIKDGIEVLREVISGLSQPLWSVKPERTEINWSYAILDLRRDVRSGERLYDSVDSFQGDLYSKRKRGHSKFPRENGKRRGASAANRTSRQVGSRLNSIAEAEPLNGNAFLMDFCGGHLIYRKEEPVQKLKWRGGQTRS